MSTLHRDRVDAPPVAPAPGATAPTGNRPGTACRELSIYDLDLAGRARAGDRDAFGELYQRHHTQLTHYVATRLHHTDPDGVADVVHDAFCAALADPHLLGTDVAGSLLHLATDALTSHDRSRRRYLQAAYATYDEHRHDAPGDAHAPVPAAQVDITQALARLSDTQRRVIQHRYLEGMSRREVAALLGRSEDTIRALERQALRRLHTDTAGDTTVAKTDGASATGLVAAGR